MSMRCFTKPIEQFIFADSLDLEKNKWLSTNTAKAKDCKLAQIGSQSLTTKYDIRYTGGGGATDPFREMGVWRNSTETQQSGHDPRSGDQKWKK